MTSLQLELYVPTSGWNTAGSGSGRDEGLQRKTVLLNRLFSSGMQNVGWNLDLEYPKLLVPASPLLHGKPCPQWLYFYRRKLTHRHEFKPQVPISQVIYTYDSNILHRCFLSSPQHLWLSIWV